MCNLKWPYDHLFRGLYRFFFKSVDFLISKKNKIKKQKKKMAQLCADCLNEIFEYLENDEVTLLSCLLVNRLCSYYEFHYLPAGEK